MPIFNGADLTHEDIETVNSAVLNVVGSPPVPTVGAGCYPVPMYPSVPAVFSAPLPTFWMARPRNVTAAPLSRFPVTSIAAPPGMAGISISQANMPFVWGVSGYPERTVGGAASGFRTGSSTPTTVAGQVVLDLATGNWDGAFMKAGVGQAPVQLPVRAPQQPQAPGQEQIVVLLAAPTPTPNICGRVAKRLAYILSDLHPAFSGAQHTGTVGNPVIPVGVQLQNSDLVSLRDAAIATGLELAGFRDPAVIQAALSSNTLASVANGAMARHYEQLVRQDLAQEGVTVAGCPSCRQHSNGALTISGGPEVVGAIGDIFGSIAAAVSSAAGPISSLVNSVSAGKLDLNQLANAVTATLPAISMAAAAMGAGDISKAAKGLSASFAKGMGSVKNALSLVNALAKRAGTNPANLGVAVVETARQIAVEKKAPRSLVEELSAEELGGQAAIIADAERRPRRPSRRRRRRRGKAPYSRRQVKNLIEDMSYVSSSPEDLIEVLEEALGSRAARRDPVRALNQVLADRLEYFQQEQLQQQQFEEESEILALLQKKLSKVRSKKAAQRLLKKFLRLVEDYAEQYQQ